MCVPTRTIGARGARIRIDCNPKRKVREEQQQEKEEKKEETEEKKKFFTVFDLF
jgi:hypothetical protein